MNATKRVLNTLLLLVFAAGLLGFNVQAASASSYTCEQYYTVQRGDYLVKIARMFDVTWRYLAEINNLEDPTHIYAGQKLCVDARGVVTDPELPDTGGSAKVWADRVVEDRYATIEASDLPANTRFQVLFSRPGANESFSFTMGSAYSDRYGDLQATFDIPAKLVDVQKITVSLLLSGRVVATNWFYNATASGNTGGKDYDEVDDKDMSLVVTDVFEDEEVILKGYNFPAKTEFDVWMAERGVSRQKWYDAGEFATVKKGTFEESFDIPRELWGADEIAVLFESRDGNYDVSTWFSNQDNQDIDETVPDFPFLTPVEVVRDETLTIKFTKLPAGVEYDVLMGEIGSKGIDGILVGTVRSSTGGTVVKSFNIPAALRGEYSIAIRMEAPSRGANAYAYNWFRNATTR